ncbi:BTAF1 [Cordylochernes scorpioides]|uniref:BTAF1 n=1 Tax=Cordylochernes scorpioides TaxID=51811 RepID=A0ABY6KWB6_9ARAC|nr:BTAF1 [Cordylochernes scorpioides]
MQKELVPLVFEAVFKGLQDPVDDVSAVAAAALLPVAKCLVGILPEVVSVAVERNEQPTDHSLYQLPKLLGCLWDSLLELDDLTSSTSSIVALLASLLSHLPLSLHRQCCPNLVELVPRLWPFLQHPSETVRQAVLQALAMFSKNEQFKNECLPSILPNILRLLIQQCLQEQKLQILDLTYQSLMMTLLMCPDNHRKCVWRCFGQRVDPGLTFEHHTGPQQFILVCCFISFYSRTPLVAIPGTLTSQWYKNEIL